MRKKLWHLLWLLVPIGAYSLQAILNNHPELVENLYSRGVYPVLTKIIGTLTGWIPFSLVEFLIYLAILSFVITLIVTIVRVIVSSDRLKILASRVIGLVLSIGFLYTAFVLGWGLNYARQPLHTSMGYETQLYSSTQLYEVTVLLAKHASQLRTQVEEDENGYFSMSIDRHAMLAEAAEVYTDHSDDFMNLCSSPRIKPITMQNFLSSTNIQGIFSPFTYEPNVNMQMPDLFFASSCLHEYAHLQGFAREDEAEFLSFYVSYRSDIVDYAYSGTAMALLHALNTLYGEDPDLHRAAREYVSADIWADFEQHSAYWDAFKSPIAEASRELNDNYLQFNRQEDGVKSYGRMMDIIIAMYTAGDLF